MSKVFTREELKVTGLVVLGTLIVLGTICVLETESPGAELFGSTTAIDAGRFGTIHLPISLPNAAKIAMISFQIGVFILVTYATEKRYAETGDFFAYPLTAMFWIIFASAGVYTKIHRWANTAEVILCLFTLVWFLRLTHRRLTSLPYLCAAIAGLIHPIGLLLGIIQLPLGWRDILIAKEIRRPFLNPASMGSVFFAH